MKIIKEEIKVKYDKIYLEVRLWISRNYKRN
jgi:hypothetical protein